nr:zinc finger, CCHC-type [Tanacetum cinerariifolium]
IRKRCDERELRRLCRRLCDKREPRRLRLAEKDSAGGGWRRMKTATRLKRRCMFRDNQVVEKGIMDSNDLELAQRRLEDKQPEEKTNTDCLVKEQENKHLGVKVGANITVTGVPGHEGAKDNVAEKKKVKESMKTNLKKLLMYKAWLTRNITRPFLATARAIIDVHEGKLSLRVGSKTVTFNIGKTMKAKYSRDDYLHCVDHTAKLVREQWVDTVDHDRKWVEAEEEGNQITKTKERQTLQPIHYASKTMNEAHETTQQPKKNFWLLFSHFDLGKLTKAKIRDLFPKEQLMIIFDRVPGDGVRIFPDGVAPSDL